MDRKPRIFKAIILFGVLALLQSCSFHLRETTPLAKAFKQLQIVGATENNALYNALQTAIEEAGGQVDASSKAQIRLSNIREGKRIAAYNSERKARIYLLYLKLNYAIFVESATGEKNSFVPRQRINLDKTFLYDANFALGKVKEEEQIRESLYAEAARLILLRIRSASR